MTETIGQRLKKARDYRNLTLEKVEEATHIRVQFLQALEADDFSAMPSPVQARGFLRNYADYLELNLDQMVDELRTARSESVAEAEVIFEGERLTPSPESQEPEPEGEGEEPQTETLTEPFWQTWLRKVRSEAGKADEELVSQPALELSTDSGPEPSIETDASQELESETVKEKPEDAKRPKLWASLLEWANIRIRPGQTEASPGMDIEEEPEKKSEPESQPIVSGETTLESQKIINNIGLQLRQRREVLSLTLEEIERHTRMRAQFLKSLEKGAFDELPSSVQTRGMLSNYASFLDLDVDDLLLQFAEVLQARHRERHPEKPARRRGQPNIPENVPVLRTFIAGDLVFGVGMIVLLAAFAIWGISRVIALQSEQQGEVQAEETGGPSISEALIGTPEETIVSEVTLIPAEDTPIPNIPEGTFEIPTLAVNVNVQVNIVAVERSYLQVTVDGEVAFDGRTIPGNAYPFEAEESIEILAGNGSALRVVYNQRDLGLLGGFGQIARFIYTADEILVPTPVVPPTPTNTPFVSPTPSITPSPTLTQTALPAGELE